MTKKLTNIYGEDKLPSASKNNFESKTEPTFYTKNDISQSEDELDYPDDENQYDTYYTRYKNKPSRFQQKTQDQRPNQITANRQGSSSVNWREQNNNRSKGKNPMTKSGVQTRCRICQSINHWERDCPDKHPSDVTFTLNELVLHACEESALKELLSETWSCAVLDCGASKSVCGKIWMKEYIHSLNEEDQAKVKYEKSSNSFRFGDGVTFKSIELAYIPAWIGENPVTIAVDIINATIPLLLSKSAMKKANGKVTLNLIVLTYLVTKFH